VAGERLEAPDHYGDDRFFVYLRMEGDENDLLDKGIDALEAAGHPVVRIAIDEKEDLGGEFFRWEMATAAAGAVLGINPFDQPNVEAAKSKAREMLNAFQETGSLPADTPTLVERGIEVFGGTGKSGDNIRELLADFVKLACPGDYVALMAYVPRTDENDAILESIRLILRLPLPLATAPAFSTPPVNCTRATGIRGFSFRLPMHRRVISLSRVNHTVSAPSSPPRHWETIRPLPSTDVA
jgi:hypothetical protein